MIVIDTREQNCKLAKEIAKIVDTECRVLDGGDYLIPCLGGSNVLIERMTITDFLGKVKSKRLFKQIGKMESMTDNFWLLIEEPYRLKFTKWNIASALSLLTTLSDKYKVFISYGINWSLHFILTLHKRYAVERDVKYYECRAKLKDMSIEDMAVYMLMGVRGIGKTTAEKLLKEYSIKEISNLSADGLGSLLNSDIAKRLYDVMRTKL